MTTNAAQIRIQSVLLRSIDELVKQGFYRNKSEDAMQIDSYRNQTKISLHTNIYLSAP